jgi:LPXTG-motif cell wall-anchored protein
MRSTIHILQKVGAESMNHKLQPNEIQLFGQRFHACVAVFYLGLGLLLGNAAHRWFPDAAPWLPLIGLALLLAAAGWWLWVWRRQRDRA